MSLHPVHSYAQDDSAISAEPLYAHVPMGAPIVQVSCCSSTLYAEAVLSNIACDRDASIPLEGMSISWVLSCILQLGLLKQL
jgi:hypothetical protein